MRYIVDIDNTICRTDNGDYPNSYPLREHINEINALYDQGHEIIYWTARGSNTGKDWEELTHTQLLEWECKFDDLWMKKPAYDVWIGDKADWIFE